MAITISPGDKIRYFTELALIFLAIVEFAFIFQRIDDLSQSSSR